MRTTELIRALRRLSIETGRVACLGCKYEYRCGIHGCAIICEAAARLEELRERVRGPRWISVKDRLPELRKNVLVLYDVDTDIDIRSKVDISYREKGKTSFEFEDIYGPATHWMPLPEMPAPAQQEGGGAK